MVCPTLRLILIQRVLESGIELRNLYSVYHQNLGVEEGMGRRTRLTRLGFRRCLAQFEFAT